MTATKIFLHKILNSFFRVIVVGLGRLELPTSPLSGVRSNQAELQTQKNWKVHSTTHSSE